MYAERRSIACCSVLSTLRGNGRTRAELPEGAGMDEHMVMVEDVEAAAASVGKAARTDSHKMEPSAQTSRRNPNWRSATCRKQGWIGGALRERVRPPDVIETQSACWRCGLQPVDICQIVHPEKKWMSQGKPQNGPLGLMSDRMAASQIRFWRLSDAA